MSAAEAQSEPTMEEILASIRRIISEDDTPAPAEAESVDEVLELKEPEPAPIAANEDDHVSSDFDFDALDIGDEEINPISDAHDEIIAVDREPEPVMEFDAPPEPEPVIPEHAAYEPPAEEYKPQPQPQVAETYQPKVVPPQIEESIGLIGADAANAASQAFAKLGPAMPGHFAAGPSVEELVAYLLKPMLKDWLDKNLPRIVEERVEAELARIARRGF